jgi:hypothetical protein
VRRAIPLARAATPDPAPPRNRPCTRPAPPNSRGTATQSGRSRCAAMGRRRRTLRMSRAAAPGTARRGDTHHSKGSTAAAIPRRASSARSWPGSGEIAWD